MQMLMLLLYSVFIYFRDPVCQFWLIRTVQQLDCKLLNKIDGVKTIKHSRHKASRT